jgi:transposase
MTFFKLRSHECRQLKHLLKHSQDATTLRRVQALLWLNRGESVVQVATRLGVSRQVIYQWIALFHRKTPTDLATRLTTGARSGRPRAVHGIMEPLINEVIDQDPHTFDYNSTIWTAPLLTTYLTDLHGVVASVPSVRLALARLKISWKRPRHFLALRSPTWRQAKGGLKRGFRRVSVR